MSCSRTQHSVVYIFSNTVNSEIFTRTLFLRNGKITLSFIDIGKSCLSRKFFTFSFNVIPENKILTKISESTALCNDIHNKVAFI